MKELILSKETMSSVEIAELTGKEHYNVIRDIRTLSKELQPSILRRAPTKMQINEIDLVSI